ERLLKTRAGFGKRRARRCSGSGLTKIVHRFFGHPPLDRVVGQPLDLFTKVIGIEGFNNFDDTRVNVAAVFVENPAVCDLVRERMLEAVLQVREKLSCLEEFRRLEIINMAAKLVLREPSGSSREAAR